MKQLATTMFLIAFTVQTFNKAVIFIDFYTNQKYIAENFCVNKAKPKMNCNGKCQLSKKITNEDNKDKQNSNRKNENKDDPFSQSLFTAFDILDCVIIKAFPPFYPDERTHCSFDIFHPPCL